MAAIQTDVSTISPTNVVIQEEAGVAGGDFRSVPLTEGLPSKKVPRRVLHFSDGILEEYSTDEEEEDQTKQPAVDSKKLKWIPWFWYNIVTASTRALAAADFCGEKLAWFFGITSPKYHYALTEYQLQKQEEEEEKQMHEREKEAERQRKMKHLAEMEGGALSDKEKY